MVKVDRSCICCSLWLFLGAACLIIGLVLVLDFFPDYIKTKIDDKLALHNGSEQGDRFVNSTVPIYFKFYFFNVTNKDEVNNGMSAVLEELGPYVFREEKYKEVSSWNESSGVIQYKERRTYYFEPNMTNGDLSDRINHVNPVGIAIANKIEKDFPLFSWVVRLIGLKHQYIETHTVEELTFEGYDISDYFPKIPIIPLDPCKDLINCTFAFYYGKNESTGKDYEVSSGVLGMDDYTTIKKYDDKPELTYWFGETCNALNGTDGQQFPPGVDDSKPLYVFTDDVCRSLMFLYEKDVSVEGIGALQYTIPDIVFADPNKDKDNMCFCQEDETKPCFSKAGVIPLNTCMDDKPVAISGPHFYQGDPEYWQTYKGLKPDKYKHETFLNIEPITGQVIQAAKRLQINVIVKKDTRLQMLPKTNDTFFPVFWVEESGQIDPDTAADFKKEVTVPYEAGKWSFVSIAILGGAILLILVIVYSYKRLYGRNVPYNAVTERPELDDDKILVHDEK